jgi:tetratricopeptide (TPR) repeat protein
MLLGICSPLAAQTSAQPSDLQQLLDRGAAALHQGQAAEAETWFRKAIAAAPDRPDGYMGLGMAELRGGEASNATEDLSLAVKKSPQAPAAHLFLGIAFYQLNRFDEAATALAEELKLQPDSTEVLTWLGMAQLAAGRPELATAPLDHAAQLAPRDANILAYQGRAHTQVAQQCYRQLYEIDPGSWQLHLAMAELFSSAQQHEQAVAEYKAALVEQNKNADLYESLGFEYQNMGRHEDAARAYEQALRLNPHSAAALFNLGKIRIEKEDPDAGVPLMEQAIQLHSAPAPSYYYLGYGLAAQGKYAEAAHSLEKSLAAQPTDLIRQNDWYALVRIYQKLGRNEEAQHALGEFKKLKEAATQKQAAPATAN